MKELHLPDNIKVHFAGAEVQNHFEAAKIMGVSYYLYTCFPWVSKMVFGKGLGANFHGAQFSNAYLAAWKWVELYGYNHYWYNGSHCFFGEERIHLRITDHFKIGGIFDLTYFGQFAITPYLGLRFDF